MRGVAKGRRLAGVLGRLGEFGGAAAVLLDPVLVGSVAHVAQEGDRVGHLNRVGHGAFVLVAVGEVRLQHELVLRLRQHGLLAARRREADPLVRVERAARVVEGGGRGAHGGGQQVGLAAVGPGDRGVGSVLAEELLVGYSGVCEGNVVVLGRVEELTVVGVAGLVVLAQLDVEVGDPAELTVDIPLASQA